MDRRAWLNPGFNASLSVSSTSAIRRKSSSGRSTDEGQWTARSKPTTPSSSIYSTLKNYLVCLPSQNVVRKEVVMDGILVANRNSIISFLKGMGLKPKLAVVKGETVIAVDISRMRDQRMKTKFLKLTKKIVDAGAKPSAVRKSKADFNVSKVSRAEQLPALSRANCASPAVTEPANDYQRGSRIDLNISKSWPLNTSLCRKKSSFIIVHGVTKANCEVGCETPPVEFSNEVTTKRTSCDYNTDSPVELPGKKEKRTIFKRLRHWLFSRKSKGKAKSSASTNAGANRSDLISKASVDSICCELALNEENKSSEVDGNVSTENEHAPDSLACNSSEEQELKETEGDRIPISSEKQIQSWERLNSSVSMPAVKSRRHILNRMKRDAMKGSKSLEKVAESLDGDVDRGGATLARNRIRLEACDAKYASILHNDEDFDSRFACLEEAKFADIENHVDKVKKRIMFARAMAALSHKLPKNSPKIDLIELLWPTGDGANGDQVDAATKSSFYQKFVASMNIMRCTNRSDLCDRSVMTDEPLSNMYAEFITSPVHRKRKNGQRRGTKNRFPRKGKNFSRRSNDANVTNKLKWLEPFMYPFKDDDETKKRRNGGDTGEENWFFGFLERVTAVRNSNKKGYIRTQ